MRLGAESRLTAAFLAVAAVLIFAAAGVVSSGRAYVDAQNHLEALLQSPHVLSDLSTTTGGAKRNTDPAPLTNRDAAHAAEVRVAREAVLRHLDTTERGSVMLCALAIGSFLLAYTRSLRSLRKERRLLDEFTAQANHDLLTGLPNRRFFAEWLSYAIAHARRERGHVGVLFIDINGCAAVREFHGAQANDALLIEIARRFRAASREGDLFAHLGPTEFALATPNARDGRQLALLAQRLRDQLNESSQPPLADTPIGASIGIAFFPEDANDSAGIMAAANAAMYAARRAGKNHVAFNALAA